MAKLLYIGHGAIRIISNGGQVLYCDPYLGTGYDVPCDVALVSHEHHDHNALRLLRKKENTVIIRGEAELARCGYATYECGDFVVTTVPAANKNHSVDKCVGFIVYVDEISVYIAGDTSSIEKMKELKELALDYAFLPTDGIYNMDVKEASRCADVIGAKHTVPYHTKPENLYSEEVAAAFDCVGKLIVRPNEEIVL